jgi:hypothetical protein
LAISRGSKIESALVACDAVGGANLTDHWEPGGRELAPRHGVIDCGRADAQRHRNAPLPDLGSDVLCMAHGAHCPQKVERHKTTIGRLQTNSHWVDQ